MSTPSSEVRGTPFVEHKGFTPGPWRLESDAQGPCMVMHPTEFGVAIASLSSVFNPANGFHDPAVDEPIVCEEAHGKTSYRPERVANARLVADAPNLYQKLVAVRNAVRLAEQTGDAAGAMRVIAELMGAGQPER